MHRHLPVHNHKQEKKQPEGTITNEREKTKKIKTEKHKKGGGALCKEQKQPVAKVMEGGKVKKLVEEVPQISKQNYY